MIFLLKKKMKNMNKKLILFIRNNYKYLFNIDL